MSDSLYLFALKTNTIEFSGADTNFFSDLFIVQFSDAHVYGLHVGSLDIRSVFGGPIRILFGVTASFCFCLTEICGLLFI